LVDRQDFDGRDGLGVRFADPKIEKIFHAAEYDVLCLKRDFGFQFANLFDTMVAGRILGRNGVGLAAMLEEEFGITLDKHFQRADWGQRPLSLPMMTYAQQDTHFLIALRDRMKTALQAKGLWELATEDFNRLCNLSSHNGRADHSSLSEPIGHIADDSCSPFWRISGLQDLTPRQLTVMRELFEYRDIQARLANKPNFKILSNQVLLEVAQCCPHYLQEFRLLPSISDSQIRRYGKGLLDAVQHGLQVPSIKRPVPVRLEEQVTGRLELLRSWRKKAGQKMGVESDIVLPRDMLFTIAEANPTNQSDLAGIMCDVPWRYEHFGQEILRALHH